ncbi:hypothetical protein AB0I84_41790 [Streptomyces spectabilis]
MSNAASDVMPSADKTMTLDEWIEREIERAPIRSDEWVNDMLSRFGITRA